MFLSLFHALYVSCHRYCYQPLNVHIVVRGNSISKGYQKLILFFLSCPLLTLIPFVPSFSRNNYVQFAGEIQPKGCHYVLDVPLGDKKVVF